MQDPEPWDETRARALIAEHTGREGAMLPILHALQTRFGHIPPAADPLIADALNLSKAEVHGVISFYHDFRRTPSQATRTLHLCRAEACQALGCEALIAEAQSLDIPIDTDATGLVIKTVYCLGLCALGPAGLLDGEPLARLDAPRLARLQAGADPASVQAP